MPAKTVEKNVEKNQSIEKKEEKTPATGKVDPARQRNLDAAIAAITKTFGEGSIMRLGDSGISSKIEVIPTGALALDLALGIGGLPRGLIIEILGP